MTSDELLPVFQGASAVVREDELVFVVEFGPETEVDLEARPRPRCAAWTPRWY